jgi:PAS domain S-box-containing protein
MKNKKKSLSQDLELLIDQHSDPMALSDIDGNILSINKGLAEILGYKKENLIGKLGFEYVEKEFIKKIKDIISDVLKTKKPVSFENYYKTRWLKTEIKPILDNKGYVIKLAYFVNDMTDIKERINFEKFLSDQALMGIIIVQGNDVVYLNDALTIITGYEKSEILSRGVSLVVEAIHPDHKKFVIGQLKKKLAGDKDVINRYRFKLITKSNKIKWLELYSKTIEYKNENADFINLIDVTEEKLREEDLKDVNQRWNSIIEHLPITDRIVIIDKYRKIEFLNRAYPGRSIDEVIGKKIDNFVTEDALEIMNKHLNIVFEEGRSQKYTTYAKSPDNIMHYFDTIAAPLKKEGKVVSAICIAIDNTQLREAEIKAKSSFNYMKNVLNSTSEIIFTISPDKKIALWNKSAEEKIGYKQKKVINKSIFKTNIFENIDEIKNYIDFKIQGKKVFLKELIINTIYGYKIILGSSVTIIKDENNVISDFLFVCWDITREKLTYKNLKQGRSYIIPDKDINRAINLLNDYLGDDKKILAISRNIDYIAKNFPIKNNLTFYNFSSIKQDKIKTILSSDDLKKKIINFLNENKKSLIFIDRLDYLISLNSFEKVIQTLYEINDIIREKKSIIIIRLNYELLDKNNKISIEQEFEKIPTHLIDQISIKKNSFEILNYINEQNKKYSQVNYQKIGSYFNISKVTVKKRIEALIKDELILHKKQGRSKTLYVTEKGKKIIK